MQRSCVRCCELYTPDPGKINTFSVRYCPACFEILQERDRRVNQRVKGRNVDPERWEKLGSNR